MNTRMTISAFLALTAGVGSWSAAADQDGAVQAVEQAEKQDSPAQEIAEVDASHDFAASGNWTCPDGGNYYLGQTTSAGSMKITNNGVGRVSVHVTYPNGTSDVYHLQPGACLNRNVPAGVHVDIFDGGKDGLDASGTYKIP